MADESKATGFERQLEVTRAQFQAELYEQEHRLLRALLRLFTEYRALPADDPRRRAMIKGVIWSLFGSGATAAVGVGLVTFMTLVTALAANRLLQNQVAQMEVQNHLLEAQRRAGSAVELTSILDAVSVETEARRRAEGAQVASSGPPKLSDGLLIRIRAHSRVLRPYRSVDYSVPAFMASTPEAGWLQTVFVPMGFDFPRLGKPLSPERGQLLLNLVGYGVEMSALLSGPTALTRGAREHRGNSTSSDFGSSDSANWAERAPADFSFADLREADLRAAKLPNIRLSNADLFRADLSTAELLQADLVNADLAFADLTGADLRDATLAGANLSDAVLSMTCLEGANLIATHFAPDTVDGIELAGAVVLDAEWPARHSLQADWRAEPLGNVFRLQRLGHVVNSGSACGRTADVK